MSEKLRACPFCGRKNPIVMRHKMGVVSVHWVECPECGAKIAGCLTRRVAVDLWNGRTLKKTAKEGK